MPLTLPPPAVNKGNHQKKDYNFNQILKDLSLVHIRYENRESSLPYHSPLSLIERFSLIFVLLTTFSVRLPLYPAQMTFQSRVHTVFSFSGTPISPAR